MADRDPVLTLREASATQKQLLLACTEVASGLKLRFESELDPSVQKLVKDAEETQTGHSFKTAFGIVLKGCLVESLVPGVPASKILQPGDEIVEVDRVRVNPKTCGQALIGCDVPGSFANIAYIPFKPAPTAFTIPLGGSGFDRALNMSMIANESRTNLQHLQLRRLPKELLNERKVMIEYLRNLKIDALDRNDARTSDLVDSVKKLWEKTLPDDDRLARVAKDVADVVCTSAAFVTDLERTLVNLSNMPDMDESVAEFEMMQSELPLLRSEIQGLKVELGKKNLTILRLAEIHEKMDELKDEDDVADPVALTQSLDLTDQIKRKIDKAVLARGRQGVVQEELTNDLRDANEEIQRLKKLVESLQDASGPLLRDIEHLKKMLADTRKELDSSHKTYKITEDRNDNLAKQIEMLQRQLQEVTQTKDQVIDRQKDEISEQVRALRELKDNSATAAADASAEISDLTQQLKETKRGLADETANVIELQRKVTQSSQDALDVRLRSESLRNELKAQITALQLKFADAAARADDEERSKKIFISQLDTAQGSVAQQQEQIQELKLELAAREKEVKDVKSVCDSQLETLQGKLSSSRTEADELKQYLATATEKLRHDIDELKKKLAAASDRADVEEREKSRWFEETENLHQVIQAKDLEIEELKKRVSELNKLLQDALDKIAKGEAGMSDKWKEIERLKNEVVVLQLALDTEKDKLHTQKQAFDAKCETKDLTILDFQKQLADRDRIILNSKPVLDAEMAKVQDKEQDIAARDKTIAVKNQELVDLNKQLAAVELTINGIKGTHEKVLGALRDDIDAGKLREVGQKKRSGCVTQRVSRSEKRARRVAATIGYSKEGVAGGDYRDPRTVH